MPGIDLTRVKQRLAEVRGALVECPLVRAFPLVLCRTVLMACFRVGLFDR